MQEVLEVPEKNKQMKIIVPMAGRGSRLRPHTLTIPKPLVPVAGVPIVEQLVRDIASVVDQPIEEVAFVLGDPAFFGDEIVFNTCVSKMVSVRHVSNKELKAK